MTWWQNLVTQLVLLGAQWASAKYGSPANLQNRMLGIGAVQVAMAHKAFKTDPNGPAKE